ncbi:unnamed protein product [Urochloa humidicola]
MASGCGGGQLWKRGSRKPRRGILDFFNLNRTPTGSEGAMALRNRGCHCSAHQCSTAATTTQRGCFLLTQWE